MRLKSCCFCVNDLEKASRIIAIVHIVLGTLIIINSLFNFNVTNIVSGAITIVIGIILLIGVNKKNTSAIKVYLVISIISIVVYVIAAVLTIGALLVNLHASHRYRYYRADYILLTLGITAGMSIISIGLSIYFVLVVYSHYSALKDGEHQPVA